MDATSHNIDDIISDNDKCNVKFVYTNNAATDNDSNNFKLNDKYSKYYTTMIMSIYL